MGKVIKLRGANPAETLLGTPTKPEGITSNKEKQSKRDVERAGLSFWELVISALIFIVLSVYMIPRILD